jgi:hypothetical protein
LVATFALGISVEIVGPTIVYGGPVTLQAITNPQLPNATYQWHMNGVLISVDTVPILNMDLQPSQDPYCFRVLVTDLESGCHVLTPWHCIDIEESSCSVEIDGPTVVCENFVVLQAVTDPEFTNATYQWHMNGMLIAVDSVPVLHMNLQPSPDPYCFSVRVTDMESDCNAMSPTHCVYVEDSSKIAITSDKIEIDAGEIVELSANVSGLFKRIYRWFADGVLISEDFTVIYVSPAATTTYTFTATSLYSDECVSESNEITIIVNSEVITSILDLDESNDHIIFYPNPSNGQFTITSEKIIESIELYDALGKRVFGDVPKTKTTQINTNLQSGTYFYRAVLQDNSIRTGKIIIQ